MKKLFIPFVIIIALIFTAIGGALWWNINTKPPSDDNTPVRFVIPKGRSATQISQKLYEEGLIRSPLAFKFYVSLTGKADSIQAGEFQLSKSLTPSEIITALSKGPLQLWVSIPEGLRREEIVERVITGLEIPSAEQPKFRTEFLQSSTDLEGFLFPDTYLFPRDVTAGKVVSTLKNTFDKKFDSAMKEELRVRGRSLDEVVTMASILEKETKNKDPEERPTVAGILWKRIKEGWPLQVDAAVQYALGSKNCKTKVDCEWWPKNLTREDLDIQSPFNTYKYPNLPPAPISNPGLSSLKAALSPTESEYWYYIHDPEGIIHYGKDLKEHNENIRIYLGK